MAAADASALFAFLSRFPREEVIHAVPALVFDISRAAPSLPIPEPVAHVIQDWMKQHKIGPQASELSILKALDQTYGKRPVLQELALGLAELLRSLASQAGEQGHKALFGNKAPAASHGGTTLEGAVKANPLARFAVGKKSSPSSSDK